MIQQSVPAIFNAQKKGTERLGLILHRMREATRLEQLLQHAELEPFDFTEMIRIATENYRTVYSDITFNTQLPNRSIYITGNPDLITQVSGFKIAVFE